MRRMAKAFKPSIIIALCLVITSNFCNANEKLREEFNGPMQSWANVKSRFGAKGDGRSDDTRSFQMALDSLTCGPSQFNMGENAYTVIYVPRGRYKISKSLLLKGKIGIAIIGEDPNNTSFEWYGKEKDTMFLANGSGYYKISRLSFNGRNVKDVEGLGIHWLNRWLEKKSRSFASVNIEISDCKFINLNVGLGGGFKWNDSEIVINRCEFRACYKGIQIRGANALDYWIWNTKFFDCVMGIANYRGNYHVYNSYFKNSKLSDIVTDNGYYTSVRGSYSDNSNAFSLDKGSSTNPFKRVFQGNYIVRPKSVPIIYHHIGKPTLLENKFDEVIGDTSLEISRFLKMPAKVTKVKASVSYTSWFQSIFTILSLGNEYYYKTPFDIPNKFPKKNYIFGDTYENTVLKSAVQFLDRMPTTPLFVKRRIFEVPRNANSKIIQEIVLQAAAQKGTKPVVHFPYGEYLLDSTIVVPSGADIQFVGDGLRYATVLRVNPKIKFKGVSLFLVKGPSFVQFSELQFGSYNKIKNLTAIVFDNIDQKGSSVLTDQLYSGADTAFFINGYNYTYFQKNNSFFSDGNVIIGGNEQRIGKGTLKLNCFAGSYSRISVKNNASFLSKDCWWEGAEQIPLDLKGDGKITIDGTKIAPHRGDSMTIIRINQFNGKVSIMNAYIQGGIEIQPVNPGLEFLLWNANFYYKKDIMGTFPKKSTGKFAYAGITSQCFYKDDPYCTRTKSFKDLFLNVSDEALFLYKMTEQTRMETPKYFIDKATGISNIYMSRISFESVNTSLAFIK